MSYVFIIDKSENTEDEKFLSALNCSKESIMSILYEYNLDVEIVSPNKIKISFPEATEINSLSFSLKECKEKIKGAFTFFDGIKYTEFRHIRYKEV